METIVFILLATLGLAVLIVLFSRLSNSNKTKIVGELKQIKDIKIDEGNPEGLAVRTVQKMYNDNIALPLLDIYIELGMPKEIAYSKNVELINKNLPFKADSELKDIFNSYCHSISNRFYLQNDIIHPIDHNEYNLNLNEDEKLYYRINLTNLFEEKVTKREVFYSGTRWNSGMMRAGSLSLMLHEIENFVLIDIGRLFITDKRLIFVGKKKNIIKAISLKNIITYFLYQDGVLILQGNKKGVLFKFEHSNDFAFLQDGLNEFTIIVSRILNKNYTLNLQNPYDATNINSELINKIPNELIDQEFTSSDPLLKEAAILIVKSQNVSTSLIQRAFSIGYARSERIIDELERLKIIGHVDKDKAKVIFVKEIKDIDNYLK